MLDLVEKRPFLAGLTCLTYGWFEQHSTGAPISAGDEWRFHFGNDIGERARAVLGDGKMLPSGHLHVATSVSGSAVADPANSLLFEVTFVAANCVARADAMRRVAGGWELIEVKSGKSPKNGEGAKNEYLDDIAFTLFVIRAAGVHVERAILMLVNREYRLDGDAPLFVELDVTTEASARAAQFAKVAPLVTGAMLSAEKPTATLIFACRDCPHFAECVGAGIHDHLFVLPRLTEKKFDELREYQRIANLPAAVKLTDPQRRIAEVCQCGEPRVEPVGLKILEEIVWPAYYLDFEAVMPPLPWFAASPPYEAAPFQFSLHRCDSLSDQPQHFEYLAPHDSDWRRELTEQLLALLGTSGSVVVYSSYEKTRLNALAELFGDLKPQIDAVVERLFDLERVFKQGYCHPKFGGKTSIKRVLPVLVPELTYDGMPVANGDDALAIFSLMRVGRYAAETHATHRENLLRYCALDTRAMVELHRAVAAYAS